MSSSADRYALRGGAWGRDRLAILARDRWPDTAALLSEVGIRPGSKCVDIGCGGGAGTLELARIVGPTGSVIGIDRDGVKIELARESARDLQLENVEFRELPLSDWSEPNSYDLVYSRFLLQHLSAPSDALRQMWGAVRPGGALAVEDVDHDGWSSVPPSPGIDFLRIGLKTAIGSYGGDARLGRRLFELFGEAGIPMPRRRKTVRSAFSSDTKILAPLTLESIQESLARADPRIADGYATSLNALNELVRNPDAQIQAPTLYQVYAHKASPKP